MKEEEIRKRDVFDRYFARAENLSAHTRIIAKKLSTEQ
jgi:hypothetical protein